MNKDIQKTILRSLILSKMWGGKHTEIRNLQKGLPSYIFNNKQGKKDYKNSIKELIRKEFLLTKKSTYEIHISLNLKKNQKLCNILTSNNQPNQC